ncbi:cytosolic endo-beta-N-acetylglucosaminidase [Rhipicephalus microplus]|uniref:cytosolic endo-beta-N-acetylglucosaminidase n=1 Tax=Rhipicephalus microplus TaxID=6941 RepID=UPI003F6AC936
MAHGEVRPLDTLDELLAFTEPQPCIVEVMREVKRGDGHGPRIMFCHDMMGGYLEDRFIHGCDKPHAYRFHHWQLIDSFVYYAHHLVTIPPPGWISAGHRHGVKVLGTLNLRSLAGIQFINKIRGSRLEKEVASQLARIATAYNFDGWLVSIACRLAVAEAQKYGLSASIFAAGWVYQTQSRDKFMENQCRFWKFPDKLCNDWCIVTLPLKTSFCQGFGERLYKDGKVVSQRPWYNLAKQQLQPRDQGTALCGGCGSATVDSTIAYNGGGCLRLQFNPKKVGVEPYFRLFGCDLLLGALRVTYAMQQRGADHVGCDVAIVLTVRPADDETEKIRLGLNVTVPDEQRYAVARDYAYSLAQDTSESGWVIRRYTIRDLCGEAKLQEIGAALESSAAICCLLGQIEVERPSDIKENVEKDIDDGPGIASDDDDWEPSAKTMCL